jgi:hypothetical protein
MKNAVFWDVTPCGSVRTDVSEECIVFIIRVTGIGELGATLVVTGNRSTLRASVGDEVFTAVTMENIVFCYIKTQFVPHRRHITSPLQIPAG